MFAAAILLRKLAPSLPNTEPLKQYGRNTGGNRSGSLGARRRGILYVFYQWRQVQISPGTQAQDREAGTHPGASETRPEPTQDRKLCNRKDAESGGRMTAITFASPLSGSLSEPLQKKRVLLLDTSAHKRELRAEIMRKVGIEVDSGRQTSPRPVPGGEVDLYDLVLVNTHNNQGHRDKFCDDIRAAAPSQRFAFLVGKPEYLSHSPSLDATAQNEEASRSGIWRHKFPPRSPICRSAGGFWKRRGESPLFARPLTPGHKQYGTGPHLHAISVHGR